MATNRPQDLDEAMFRRIRCVFELTSPHHAQRLQIWRRLTSAAGIVLADGVDLAEISLKYEITGGYIRNAVLAALLSAVGRAPRAPRLTQADLHAGCREQMRGALQAAELESRLVPLRSLDQMVVPPPLLASLRSLVALEKARALLHAAGWGMDEQRGQQRGGTTALFWGPPGCGKRAAAEALAFELGRPMKVVHLAQLASICGSGGGGRAAKGHDGLGALFREARLADALLVLTGSVASDEVLEARLLELLLHEMSRYPGVVVLCCSSYDAYDAVVHTIAPTLLAAMRSVLDFALPDAATRERLWRALLPEGNARLDCAQLAAESHGFGAARISGCIYQVCMLTMAMRL